MFGSGFGFLMVVHDFDLRGIGSGPRETNPPLIVDADAVLAGATAFQDFQAVARRQAKEGKFGRGIDELKFGKGALLDIRRKAAGAGAMPELSVPGSAKLLIITQICGQELSVKRIVSAKRIACLPANFCTTGRHRRIAAMGLKETAVGA
jgi:hypothetical protein